jgi:hypothetical protein
MRWVGWNVATLEARVRVEVQFWYGNTALFGPFSTFWSRSLHTPNFMSSQAFSVSDHSLDFII